MVRVKRIGIAAVSVVYGRYEESGREYFRGCDAVFLACSVREGRNPQASRRERNRGVKRSLPVYFSMTTHGSSIPVLPLKEK